MFNNISSAYKMSFLICLFALISPQTRADVKLDTTNISLSGLSSGGYMATQYHLSHADSVIGVGVIAAGPYNCARGSISTALSECVNVAPENYPSSLFNIFTTKESIERLASKEALKNDKVWLLHGTLDTRISADVASALFTQYKSWLSPDTLVFINDKPFSHVFPTLNTGKLCSSSETPYIGNCNFDAAGEILKHIYGQLEAPVSFEKVNEHGELLSIKQEDLADMSGTGMHEDGFVFVPTSCREGELCQIHLSFHGCNQSIDNVNNAYAQQTGLNEWAASNRLIVLYPQVEKSRFMPMNPQACWDWWGYTDENYANKEGKQIKAVYNMVNNLAVYLNDRFQ